MKLDLPYEIDVSTPLGNPHPHGQPVAEQRACAEALERGGVEVDAPVSAS